ncbi:MAG TPA: ATP-binding protein, partial [Gammaproteobacteria bacterium]|nr:ATP-binding protein [Gammaproteobacteria bacterium]
MAHDQDEDELLRSVALKNAETILVARQRAERELLAAKEVHEQRTQELAGSLAMMRATLESTFDGILVADSAGRITGFNERYVEMWKIPREIMDTRDHRQLLGVKATQVADPQRLLSRVEEIYAAAPAESFDLLELTDGRVIERYSRIQIVEDRNVGRVWSFRDITASRRAQDELRDQREWFRVTLSSIGDGVITTDMRGCVTFLNPVAEAMTGWQLADASGLAIETVCYLINEESRNPVENPIKQVLREGLIVGLANHTALIGKDGTETAIEDSAAPIRDGNGQVTGAVMVFHDVTGRRRAAAALREETRVLELLNRTGIAIAAQLDSQALLQTVTDAATELSGAKVGAFFYNTTGANGDTLSPSALAGATPEAFAEFGQSRATPLFAPTFRGEAPVRIDDVLEDFRCGQVAPHHGVLDGHRPVRSYLGVPVKSRSGEVFGGLFFGHPKPGVFTERTERVMVAVAAQAAIALDNARLYEAAQREIANRERAEGALRDADRRKDEFLATLAHELRNPLAPILQAALIWKTPEATPEQKLWSHDVITRQAHHMSLLLDDLLDISRITRGSLEVRKAPTKLAFVVASAVETARPAIDAKRHTLTIDIPQESVRFAADPLRIAQVLSNLLTNAAKYTNPQGQIRLSAACSDGALVIKVTDNGIGISSDAIADIFLMFSQVRPTHDRSAGGLGIGLALAKRVIELHDGTIEATSAGLGLGSEFTVRLPIGNVQPQTTHPAPRPVEPPAAVTRRVLIADDNADVVESLAMLLRMDGHEVAVAHDGQGALANFMSFRPEVALLDIGMPSLDGYEVARKMREASPDRAVMLIAMTGWGQERDKARAKEAGFDHHFTK